MLTSEQELRFLSAPWFHTDTFEFLKGLITCHALFSLFGLWVNFQFLRRSNVDTDFPKDDILSPLNIKLQFYNSPKEIKSNYNTKLLYYKDAMRCENL